MASSYFYNVDAVKAGFKTAYLQKAVPLDVLPGASAKMHVGDVFSMSGNVPTALSYTSSYAASSSGYIEDAEAAAKALFSGEGDDENMPTTELDNVPEEGIQLLDAMVIAKLITSKGEGRRLVEQGGVSVNGEKVTDVYYVLSKEALKEGVKVKKGKKVFHKLTLK